jgi:hypothetical protein
MTEFTRTVNDDSPRYEVLKEAVLANEPSPGPFQALTHIKTGDKHIVRVTATDTYAEVGYVVVGQSRVTKKDERGTFTYEETTIVASDEVGAMEPALLYIVPRIVPVEHAMFSIGEIPK